MAGRLDVDRMLRELSPRQWMEWEAFAALEPFGAVRDNYHVAVVAKMVADAAGLKKAAGKPAKPDPAAFQLEDFLLRFDHDPVAEPPKRKQTWQEQKAMAKLMVEAFNLARQESAAHGHRIA